MTTKPYLQYLLTEYPKLFVRKQFYQQYFRLKNTHESQKFIILLGHMRSGSTLLTKLLCNSSEVLGYGETHVFYDSIADIEVASGKILFVLREWIKNNIDKTGNVNFFFDKVLYNHLFTKDNPKFLLNDNIQIIFLIRTPYDTMSSMMNLPQLNLSDERSACDHYTERLKRLVEYGKFLDGKKPFFFLTYQQILSDTDGRFRRLEEFLGLTQSLTEHYDVTINRSGSGDPSVNLLLGNINRDKKKTPDLFISPQIVEEATVAYNTAYEILLSASQSS